MPTRISLSSWSISPYSSIGREMFSPTVIELKRAPDWNAIPSFRRSSASSSSSIAVISLPQ